MAENGWTKEFPPVNGYYLVRQPPHDPYLIEVTDQFAAFFGLERMAAKGAFKPDHEFLGPFTVSDFEQLAALREVATKARDWFAWWVESTEGTPPIGTPGAKRVLAALREALNPELAQGEKS